MGLVAEGDPIEDIVHSRATPEDEIRIVRGDRDGRGRWQVEAGSPTSRALSTRVGGMGRPGRTAQARRGAADRRFSRTTDLRFSTRSCLHYYTVKRIF